MIENNVVAVLVERNNVLERYYKELVAFFSHALRDRETASDVVHESYARVLAMDPKTDICEPRALLYRIAKNIVIDTVRRRQVEANALDTLSVLNAESAPSVEWEIDVRQRLEFILDRLAVMPRKRREAFVLVKIYGYTHVEAAARLASTVSAIEKHVVRGVMDCMDMSGWLD